MGTPRRLVVLRGRSGAAPAGPGAGRQGSASRPRFRRRRQCRPRPHWASPAARVWTSRSCEVARDRRRSVRWWRSCARQGGRPRGAGGGAAGSDRWAALRQVHALERQRRGSSRAPSAGCWRFMASRGGALRVRRPARRTHDPRSALHRAATRSRWLAQDAYFKALSAQGHHAGCRAAPCGHRRARSRSSAAEVGGQVAPTTRPAGGGDQPGRGAHRLARHFDAAYLELPA